MNDVSKLPKWAQQHITMLEANIEHWRKLATAGPENSDTFVARHNGNQPLGASPLIQFNLPDGSVIRAYIHDRGALRVEAEHGALHVVPSASNSVRLSVGEY